MTQIPPQGSLRRAEDAVAPRINGLKYCRPFLIPRFLTRRIVPDHHLGVTVDQQIKQRQRLRFVGLHFQAGAVSVAQDSGVRFARRNEIHAVFRDFLIHPDQIVQARQRQPEGCISQ